MRYSEDDYANATRRRPLRYEHRRAGTLQRISRMRRQARAEADAMLAHFENIGDARGVERARAFQAQMKRAVRIVMGRRDDA